MIAVIAVHDDRRSHKARKTPSLQGSINHSKTTKLAFLTVLTFIMWTDHSGIMRKGHLTKICTCSNSTEVNCYNSRAEDDNKVASR